MNNSQKKNDKKPTSTGFIIFLIFAILGFFGNVLDSELTPLIFIAIFVVVICIITIGAAKKKAANSENGEKTQAGRVIEELKKSVGVEKDGDRPQPSKVITQMNKAKEYKSCDDEHYKPIVNDVERRTDMLNNMRKSGLISAEEYAIMKKRWGI